MSKSSSFWVSLLISAACLFPGGPVRADDVGWLPPAHDVFKPLLADPRELQYALRAVFPVSRRPLGEADIGDYLGVYRWDLPGDDAYFQTSIGGGMFGRFDLASRSNALDVVDFFANLPFDLRIKKWSARFMPYHVSSHLGDDYIEKTGATPVKHAWDVLRWVVSWDATSRLRLYGGYSYVFRTLPHNLGRNAVEGGFEVSSPWVWKGHAQLFWANDLQSWQRVGWNPTINSQAGIKFAKDPEAHRAISLFIGYMSGHRPHGQFYLDEESRWNLGVKFDLT